MGLGLRLPVLETTWPELRQSLDVLTADPQHQSHMRDLQILLSDGEGQTSFYDKDLTGRCVLVIGSEATGISDEARRWPGAEVVRVPTAPLRGLESLNAAVCGSILLAEAARQRGVRNK